MRFLGSLLIGYMIGGINPAYLFAKRRGFDIRKHGSKNAGASNAVITMGKKVGFLAAIFDIIKAFFAVKLSELLFPGSVICAALSGAGCIVGHIFPVFLRFRGGKGLACLGGVILAFHPVVFALMLAAEIILVLLVDYICVVPITASVIFPVIYRLMTLDAVGTTVYSIVAFIVICKHIENLRRIYNGTEFHFSFLWKKDKELDRMEGKAYDSLLDEQRKNKQ